jgi:hypothetical protein
MSQKTKTIIKETEEVSDRDNQPVLAYRVGQLEIALKDAALAQRESTESHKEGVKELKDKMDTFGSNFATKLELEKEIQEVEERLSSRVSKVESWLTWAGRIIIGAVIAAVLGLVIVNRNSL